MERILRFAASLGGSRDGRQAAEAADTETNTERRQWLDEAISNVSSGGGTNDPSDKLKEAVARLKAQREQPAEALATLAQLADWVEHADLAKDFFKLDAHRELAFHLENGDDEMQQMCAHTLAETLQHNPFCQERALNEDGLLPLILDRMENGESADTRRKALLALSALLRHNPEAQQHFSQYDGFQVLLRTTFVATDERFQTKSAFLIASLCRESMPNAGKQLCDMGFLEHLYGILERAGTSMNHSHEHLLAAACAIGEQYPSGLGGITGERFRAIINERIPVLDDDEWREEKDYCRQLLQLIAEQEQKSEEKEPPSNET